jgi:hypothetical protein
MYVLGHDHITGNIKPIALAGSFQSPLKQILGPRRGQERFTAIAT